MVVVRRFLPLIFALTGCAGPHAGSSILEWQWPFNAIRLQQDTAAIHGETYRQFSFDWSLSGDPQIMPVQVFDDGTRMWLQFAAEGAWPAVFKAEGNGMRPLVYERESPYMVLNGIHNHLELRGGHLRGSVRRVAAAAPVRASDNSENATSAASIALAVEPSAASALTAQSLPVETPRPVREAPAREPAALQAGASVIPGTGPVLTTGSVSESSADAPAKQKETLPSYLGRPLHRYAVSPADLTIRQALERWARQAGWAFSSEHWAVDVDIPLVGEAAFTTDFKSAVRELLEATEMGDRPLQPCFYSNQVLRVVPYAQPCDRRGASRAVS
ncbi:MAG TPA: TcpQ domain-containing protein [Burkholderiaceae bacterium]|nr:TcpQ domain-containing protein [Burkholderiaceae bacterium]